MVPFLAGFARRHSVCARSPEANGERPKGPRAMRQSLPQKAKRSARKPGVRKLSVYAGRLSLNKAPAVLDRSSPANRASRGWLAEGTRKSSEEIDLNPTLTTAFVAITPKIKKAALFSAAFPSWVFDGAITPPPSYQFSRLGPLSRKPQPSGCKCLSRQLALLSEQRQ